MEEKCIKKHLYERRHQTATSEWSCVYYVHLQGLERSPPRLASRQQSQDSPSETG
jgi:hypothetical protein